MNVRTEKASVQAATLYKRRASFRSGALSRSPYEAQRNAIDAGIEAAHESGKRGIDAQVLVQGTGNKFRSEWTYGHDPYPPLG
jgi:hypothetical protein